MNQEQFVQLYAMLITAGGLVILVAQLFVSRGGTANKALAVAVDSQAQVAGIVKWQMEFISSQAEERGRGSERLLMMQELLEKERLSSLDLREKITKGETLNKAALEKMKQDSDAQIELLKQQIAALQHELSDIQKKLDETIEEKKLLELQKQEAQKTVEDLVKRIEEVSRETNKLREDMESMRMQYEDKIASLEKQIGEKDEEIKRLKAELERKNEVPKID